MRERTISIIKSDPIKQWMHGAVSIWSMTAALDGSIWMGGRDRGCIARLKDGQWEDKSLRGSGYEKSGIRNITTTADGDIWVLFYKDPEDENDVPRIARWNGSQWEEIECPLAQKRGATRLRMFTAPDGNVQVIDTTDLEKIYAMRWDGKQWEDMGLWFDNVEEWLITAVTAAPDGSIWLGGIDGMTARLSNSQWKTIELRGPGSDTYSSIRDLTATPDGIIWAGVEVGMTEGWLKEAIAYWNGSKWVVNVRFSDEWSDKEEYVKAITVTPDGSIWVAGSLGIYTRFWHKIL
ncbi:hypothetical protein M1N04_01200 [Peptococcaceae bacterium]|nr:hypothetical protein [Peptococcaceae bacterium]